MTINADESLTRVTVIAPTRRVDLALPGSMTLGEALPRLLELAGQGGAATHAAALTNQPLHGWKLQRMGEDPLDPSALIADLDLRDGDFLHLRPGDAVMPDAAFDDVVDAVAQTTSSRARWSTADTRTAALVAAVGLIVLVPGIFSWPQLVRVLRHEPPNTTAAGRLTWTIAMALTTTLAGGAAVVAARRRAPFGVPQTLEYVALLMATAIGAWMLPPEATIAQRLTAAGAFVCVVALALGVAATVNRFGLLAAGLLGLLVLVECLVQSAWPGHSVALAAASMVLLVAALSALAPAAVRLARLPLTPAERLDPSAPLDSGEIIARAVRADRLHASLTWGVSVAIALLSLAALAGRSSSALVLCGCVGVTLLSRARHHRGFSQRLALLASGAAVAMFSVARLLTLSSTTVAGAIVGGVVGGVAMVGTLLALAVVMRPDRLQRLDLELAATTIEWVATAALVPVAMWLLGWFDAMSRM